VGRDSRRRSIRFLTFWRQPSFPIRVALGRSWATSLKGRHGLSLGNIIGSDIFNVLRVLGPTGMICGVEVEAAATASLAGLCVMVLVTVFFLRIGRTLSRKEGLLLITLASARRMLDLVSRTSRCGAGRLMKASASKPTCVVGS